MSSSENMIERVARAICTAGGYDPDYVGDYGWVWEDYSGHARAAIEAMMEPTPDAWLIPDAYAVIGDADRAASFVADGHDVVPLYALRTSLTGDTK